MTAPSQPSQPLRLVGRTTNRVLLAGFLLSLAASVFFLLQNSDSFMVALILTGFFGLVLAGLPSVLFLLYAWRAEPPEVPKLTRRSIYASAGALAVIGGLYAWVSFTQEDPTPGPGAVGLVVALIGIVAIVRLMRFTSPATPAAQLAYGRSSAVGLFFFLVIAIMTPKFACGCGGGKGTAYKAAVKSDLRNLAMAQDAYFADSLRYGFNRDLGESFRAQTGDSVVVQFADAKGYRAIGWHVNLPDTRCGIWAGVAPADGMHGAKEGVPLCWKEQ